eukprot:scaffold191218_cov18-Prasinocladus_malaysianus.AAC.1
MGLPNLRFGRSVAAERMMCSILQETANLTQITIAASKVKDREHTQVLTLPCVTCRWLCRMGYDR